MLIFDIKRFSTHDGPGIRTTLFLKGCPLRCPWCHNPEGIAPTPQRMFNPAKCIRCGDCGTLCPTGALQTAGREMSNEEIIRLLARESDTAEASGGGVTLSGGEPLMHPEYALQLLDDIGEALHQHRAVDTTLYVAPQVAEEVTRHCELLLVDLKHMDSEAHKRYTNVPNEPILDNIRRVSAAGHPYWIRVPMIEGVNADDGNLAAMADFLTSLPTAPQVVTLLPYHELGRSKRQRMGSTYNPRRIPMATPTEERQHAAVELLRRAGLAARVGG